MYMLAQDTSEKKKTKTKGSYEGKTLLSNSSMKAFHNI